MPALPSYSIPPSPLATLRSCISAPEPMITATPEAAAAPATAPGAAPPCAAVVSVAVEEVWVQAGGVVSGSVAATPLPSPQLGRTLFGSPQDMAADEPADFVVTAFAGTVCFCHARMQLHLPFFLCLLNTDSDTTMSLSQSLDVLLYVS